MFQTNKTDAEEEEGKKQKITLFHDFTLKKKKDYLALIIINIVTTLVIC
jgi:hypothetical protein